MNSFEWTDESLRDRVRTDRRKSSHRLKMRPIQIEDGAYTYVYIYIGDNVSLLQEVTIVWERTMALQSEKPNWIALTHALRPMSMADQHKVLVGVWQIKFPLFWPVGLLGLIVRAKMNSRWFPGVLMGGGIIGGLRHRPTLGLEHRPTRARASPRPARIEWG